MESKTFKFDWVVSMADSKYIEIGSTFLRATMNSFENEMLELCRYLCSGCAARNEFTKCNVKLIEADSHTLAFDADFTRSGGQLRVVK